MRKPEQRFWDRTRRVLEQHLHLERIENVVGVGTPDVWVLSHANRVTPLELKAVQGFPARPLTRVLGPKVGLSRDQRNWHMAWQQAGGQSAILVGVGGDRQYLFPGYAHDLINEFNQAQFEMFALPDWERIIKRLAYGWPE